MTDRREPVARPADQPAPPPAPGDEPLVLIVRERSGGQLGRLLPPLLLAGLGVAFLAYREQLSDWRGISALFESPPESRTKAEVVKAAEPVPVAKAPARELAQAEPAPATVAPPEPTPPTPPEIEAPKPEPPTPVEAKSEIPKLAEATPEPKPAPDPEPKPDPMEAIRREANVARERIAELERVKAEEAQKLEETAERREQADRLDRRKANALRFRIGRAIPPEALERMFAAQEAELRRHLRMMAEVERQQREQMAAIERDFFNQRDPMIAPPPQPSAADLGVFDRQGERRLPGGGVARFREFRGADGRQGFQFQIRSRGLANVGVRDESHDDGNDAVPPPPQPASRLRQWGIAQ